MVVRGRRHRDCAVRAGLGHLRSPLVGAVDRHQGLDVLGQVDHPDAPAAYGRNANASDAWDHAIKAAEAVLIPIVVRNQAGAHMGHVIGQLDRQGEQWNTLLRFNQTTPPVNPPTTSVRALVGMLRLLYPNPDRHIGPDHRVPTTEEARAVVQLAVTIVQWARDGQILKK